MCLFPKKILNPKLAWTESDSKYLLVPCNHCAECRAQRQSEWFVRAAYEAQRYINDGGHIFMATLTYDNDNLPVYEDVRDFYYTKLDTQCSTGCSAQSETSPGTVNFKIQCFNQDHLTSFQKIFRTNVQRRFHLCPDDIKFFICCEFGERTHRPHYHCLVYIPHHFFSNDEFLEIVRKSWTKGMVMKSKEYPWEVQSMEAVRYVCKYVTKDLYFFNKYIDEYLDKTNIPDAEYQYRKSNIKKYLPKLRSPNHFGTKLSEEILSKSDPLEFLLRDKPIKFPSKNGKSTSYVIPRYILTSILKEKDSEISDVIGRPYYVYNDLGHSYKKSKLLKRCNNEVVDMRKLVDPFYIESTLKSDDIISDNSIKNLSVTLPNLLQSIDIERLVLYRNFLRYLPVGNLGHHHLDYYFDHIDSIVVSLFKEAVPFEFYSKVRDLNVDMSAYEDIDVGLPLSVNEDVKLIRMFCDLACFREYELATAYIDMYYSYHNRQIFIDRVDK